MNPELVRMDEEIRFLEDSIREIHEEAGDQPLSEERQTSWDEGVTALNDLREQRAAFQARLDSIAAIPERKKEGPTLIKNELTANPFDLSAVRNMAPEARGVELRARALDVAERAPRWVSDEAREAMTRTVEGSREIQEQSPGSIAEHCIRHGSEEYADAFGRVLKNQDDYEARTTLNIGTNANGLFTVPTFLDPTVIRTDVGNINPLRQIARVIQVDTKTWNGLSSAGVTAGFATESAVVGDNSPTFGQPAITPLKAHCYVQASGEFLEDSALTVAQEVATQFAIAKDNLEATKFAVGSTATTEPNGIVTALQQTTASRIAATTNGSFWVGDVMALQAGVPPRWRPNGSWLAEVSIYNLVRQFSVGSAGQGGGAFWTDLGPNHPSQLMGRPAYESSAMQAAPASYGFTATASSDDVLVYGDFSEFAIVDRIGATVQFNPMVIDPTTARPIDNVGWYFRWRVGSDVLVANAFRLLRV